MKKVFLIFFTVIFYLNSSVGYSQNIICEKTGYGCPEIDFKELIITDGLYYKKFTEVPFTGNVIGQSQGFIKNGKMEGSWIGYWDNGQLSYKGEYKNGKREGSWISYWDNGQLKSKGNWKNGKTEGSWISYYDNGQLMYKGDFKNGKEDGSWVWFNKDGTVWKDYTGTYKDGKKISD